MCGTEDDVFLDGLSAGDKIKMLGAFAHAVRSKDFSESTRGNAELVASTCKSAVSNVCQAFRFNDRRDPSLDKDGKTSLLLQRQYKGYTNKDPSTKQQKPIPITLLREMTGRDTKDTGLIAFHQLIMLAVFFAMRSCEYFYMERGGDRRTKPLALKSFTFRRDLRILLLTDPELHLADNVTILFEFQKRADRDDAITQTASGDPEFCPVHSAAAIVKRLLDLGITDYETVISTYSDRKGRFSKISNTMGLLYLRAFIATVPEVYGLKPEDIGLHSIRSSAAMAMYINQIPVYTIMLLGRWSSNAFLLYIRKTVVEFSNDVSRKMIQNPTYHHVIAPSSEDPRTHNPLAASANSGMGANGATSKWGTLSIWD
jgi:hypothetical protein